MKNNQFIHPIALDLGAKNTGVFYAKYKEGSTFEEIEKHGEVLVYGNYTPLLKTRTSNRHARRGYTRKKLAKRLLAVILKEYFKFFADNHTQALGFLMNRRGFSFLEEEYSKEHLNNLPDDVLHELSEEVQNMFSGQENIADQLMDFAVNEPKKITELLDEIQNIEDYKIFQKTDKQIKRDIVYYDYIEKIKKACDFVAQGESITDESVAKSDKDKQKLSKTSNWIIERLNQESKLTLQTDEQKYQTNLIQQISKINNQQIQQKLPDFEQQRSEIKKRQTDNNKSIWNFNFSKFEFNPTNEKGLEENKIKTHLHHFCYAVYKINNEIISGGRHRSKFFDEIEYDLDKFKKEEFLSNEHNPKYLKEFILEINANKELDIDKLYKLVCHISNFELKPLREYFNNKEYKNGDKLDNKNLSKIASTWFMKCWIVTEDKDNQKKVEDYKKLKDEWKKHTDKSNIIDFWLQTDPNLTIPPYQSMTNRHPPKCQSLLLNISYLEEYYPKWQNWLGALNSDDKYGKKLKSLENGKKTNQLVSDEKIKGRQLQFILDTAKKEDPYKLNEIWSVYHKLQKLDADKTNKTKWQEKLDKVIKKSELSDELKQNLTFDDFQIKESFAHFLNKYYQTRRKARDGRYFLIQEKKEKWLTEGKLLTLCTDKPRQKKHQWQIDLAAILGINVDILKEKLGKKTPDDYFKNIKGFASNCAKAQKEHRGELKLKIQHELANKPNDTLAKLANKCDKLKQDLIKKIGIDEILADKQPNEFNQKIALVFKFAQIHNIVFKDRSGFSKTCPVCSTDNTFRMQENDKGIAKASRLPALSIRLIDGVVMRVCDAIARQVAVTKWHKIKEDLQKGEKVSIPLILEQNSFDFEPSLKKIKGKTAKEVKNDRTGKYKGQTISAYSGKALGKDGEIDHIISRASKYGVLNDEANLIYISKDDNQKKGKDKKYLDDLHKDYKKTVFGQKTDDEIKSFIYQELGEDTESKKFKFGEYQSFINLNENQQKAFRHALFLQDNDPLKEKVIQSLQNRNRAIVNGTQRYLAQCIADKIHHIARNEDEKNKTNFTKKIEFDYFEYSARWDDPKSTYNLRKKYGLSKLKKQPLYSHLIDAQLAFLLASEDHQNDGSIGIQFLEGQTIWQHKLDKSTGEILPSKSFNDIDVGEGNLEEIDLNRKKSETGVRFHRSFHRPNFYAQNYVPIFLGKKNQNKEIKVRAGFSWKNSVEIKVNGKSAEENIANILGILQFAKNKVFQNNCESLEDLYNLYNKKIQCDDYNIFYIDWDKTKIHQYFVDEFSNKDIANGKKWNNTVEFLNELSYRVQKQKITKLQDIKDALRGIKIGEAKFKQYFDIKLSNGTIEFPAKNEWQNLLDKYDENTSQEFDVFMKNYFAKKENQISTKHHKVRKVFSLPVVNALGHFLQKRKSWSGEDIYQIAPDSDSRNDGNKFSRLVLTTNGELKEMINEPFNSKNTFKLKNEELYIGNDYRNIDPNKWFKVENNNDFPKGVSEIKYRIDNTTRPQIQLYLSDSFNPDCINGILDNNLTKAKDNKALKKKMLEKDLPIFLQYTANDFYKNIIKKLLDAF